MRQINSKNMPFALKSKLYQQNIQIKSKMCTHSTANGIHKYRYNEVHHVTHNVMSFTNCPHPLCTFIEFVWHQPSSIYISTLMLGNISEIWIWANFQTRVFEIRWVEGGRARDSDELMGMKLHTSVSITFGYKWGWQTIQFNLGCRQK